MNYYCNAERAMALSNKIIKKICFHPSTKLRVQADTTDSKNGVHNDVEDGNIIDIVSKQRFYCISNIISSLHDYTTIYIHSK